MPYNDPEKLKAWKLKNRERLLAHGREYSRKYYAANKEYILEARHEPEYVLRIARWNAEYNKRPEVKAAALKYRKAYYKKYKKEIDAYTRKWFLEHPSRVKYYARKHYLKHRLRIIDEKRAIKEKRKMERASMLFARLMNSKLSKEKKRKKKK